MCWGLGLGASRLALPGRSAWLPGSWAALVYRCPEEEGPSEHWRESPLRPASHSEGAHQDSGRGDRAEGGCRDELERASEAAPGPGAALCPPARAATRSQQQEGADEGCGRQPPRHPWPALSATLLDAGSGEAPREREEMEPTGFGPWGRSHGPARAPLPALPSGLWLLHVQLVPWWRQISTTRPGAPGRAGWTASDWSSAAQDTAGQQGRGPGGDEEGVGRRGQMRLGLTCYPGGSLSYPASVCLPIGWVPAGGSGDRGARRRLGAGCAASRGLALPWAATFRRPPANAAPGRGS